MRTLDRPISNCAAGRRGEEGSALILAVLISVILSLLGVSYLMMAQTENTIAENERNATLSLYIAEAGTRLAITWFNDPSTTGFMVPTTGQVDRTKRLVDHDNNDATALQAAIAADATKPLYKDGALTTAAIFERPYRALKEETFIGIETGTDPNPSFANSGPDLIVTDAHLATINNALFPNFPSGARRARIARIEIYAPPIIDIGGTPTRMGIATIKVIGGVFLYAGTGDERQIASRVVKAVINEIPVPGPGGPLQSCANLNYNGEFSINWGAGSAAGNADIAGNLDGKSDTGLPYAPNDPNNYISGANTLATWATAHDGEEIEDPWYKFSASGAIDEATNTNVQPWAHVYPGTVDDDHSNLFQFVPTTCPTFDYSLWKAISQSGFRGHEYWAWSAGQNFRLDNQGAPVDFEDALAGKAGVIFFDTQDGLRPNGLPYTNPGTNLTPPIAMSGGGWGAQGMIYINAQQFRSTGVGGVNRTVIPPGEPGDGSGFVNLIYPGDFTGGFTISDGTVAFASFQDPVTGDWWCTDALQCDAAARIPALAPVQDEYGLPFVDDVTIDGVLYVSGTLEVQGNDNFFGSVIAEQGVIDGSGTPSFYFDESLVKGNWPRSGMDIPRVVVSSWQTDL